MDKLELSEEQEQHADAFIKDMISPPEEKPLLNESVEHCPYDAEREFGNEEGDAYCDGPGARTRSKDSSPYGKLTAPSFLVQIPFYALKKETNRKCSVCGKHGRTPSDLLRHMRVHTGERPFPCIGCDKKFKCKRSQLTHQYLTHSITDGLSTHRLQILELKKLKRPNKTAFPLNFDLMMPVGEAETKGEVMYGHDVPKEQQSLLFSDQDEDTEIVAGEDMPASSEMKTSFEGFFTSNNHPNSDEEEYPEPLSDHNSANLQAEYESSVGKSMNLRVEGANDEAEISKTEPEPPRVPILRIKTHKCTHCKRQFRSIYTLRYHLRSMHDEKVYLSPALESRLKKRRWLPPHVRLQKPKINLSLGLLLKNRTLHKEKSKPNTFSQEEEAAIEEPKENIPIPQTFQKENQNIFDQKNLEPQVIQGTNEFVQDMSKLFGVPIKTEKQDPMIENDGHLPENLSNTDLNNNNSNNSTLRSILTSKESLFNQLHQYTSTLSQQTPGANGSSALGKSNSSSYVVPPHIFLPSNNTQLDEGLEDNKPVSWESLHVTSENVLVTKMEAIHPATQQKYVLYKCSQCGKAFSGLRAISVHLASHNDNTGKDCEKCGASFKWQSELDSHMDCHRTDRKFIPSSQFLPSYYVNPFPIPVLPTGEQAVVPTTGLLSYPFFPMPQQIPPLMQPGFFPFFAAAAALQPSSSQIPQADGGSAATSSSSSSLPPAASAGHTQADATKDNTDDKNLQQNCIFQCKLCPKTFDRIFSLQRHERIHSGVKACFCKTCGRGFSELRNLRHHIVRFHADTAKMEPLPYRRQPTRVRSSSQRLVSFLKKTAVRILNSIGQSKMDPPSGSMKMQTGSSNRITAPQQQQQSQDDNTPQNLSMNQHQNDYSPAKLQVDEENINCDIDNTGNMQESKAHVNFLKVPELEDLPKYNGLPVLNETAKNIPQSKSNNINSNTNSRPLEVLQDPKRSLLGNRRKGRPFKLTPTNPCNFLTPIADENLYAITQKILSGMPKLNIEAQPFLPNPTPPVGPSAMANDLSMPQLSFFNADVQNIEPLDMSSVRDTAKSPQNVKPEVEKKAAEPSTDNIPTTTYPSVLPMNETVNALTANCKLLPTPQMDGKCMFPCSYCHRSFNSLSDLNRHMTFHADIRPFKCPYCSYCSRTNSQLKVHMMRHEGIKHYMCQICNYNGVTQSDLNRHLKTRTHLLRSRNICACCGTGFHTRSLSEEHYKSCRLMGGIQDPNKTSKDSRLVMENKNRGNRLKHVQKPIDTSSVTTTSATTTTTNKKEFFRNLYELGKMGVPFADFLQLNNNNLAHVAN